MKEGIYIAKDFINDVCVKSRLPQCREGENGVGVSIAIVEF